jgi:hypothetical protein
MVMEKLIIKGARKAPEGFTPAYRASGLRAPSEN